MSEKMSTIEKLKMKIEQAKLNGQNHQVSVPSVSHPKLSSQDELQIKASIERLLDAEKKWVQLSTQLNVLNGLKDQLKDKFDKEFADANNFIRESAKDFIAGSNSVIGDIETKIERLINIQKQIDEKIKPVEIRVPEMPPIDVSDRHREYPDLIRILNLQKNRLLSQGLYLYGPAGTGKSTALIQAANDLNIRATLIVVEPTSLKQEFFGFMNASGGFVSTEYLRAFEHGGLVILDELDSASADLIISLNSSIANRIILTADGRTITAHQDFMVAGTGNTNMSGADTSYVGRSRQDASFSDRFIFLEWKLERELELKLTGGDVVIVDFVEKLREKLKSTSASDLYIGPRSTQNLSLLIKSGMGFVKAMQCGVIKGHYAEKEILKIAGQIIETIINNGMKWIKQ